MRTDDRPGEGCVERPVRDGGGTRGARATGDGHETVLPVLHRFRRASECQYLPGVPGASRRIAGAERRCRRAGRSCGRRLGVHDSIDVELCPQTLLLSRPPKGIPDIAVRSPSCRRRVCRDRKARGWLADQHRCHASAPRRRRGPVDSRSIRGRECRRSESRRRCGVPKRPTPTCAQ
jgi:hypothetical protein